MDEDQARRWASDHKFEIIHYKAPEVIFTIRNDKGEFVRQEITDGKKGWWVSGWARPKSGKVKERVSKVGKTLIEATEKAKVQYELIILNH